MRARIGLASLPDERAVQSRRRAVRFRPSRSPDAQSLLVYYREQRQVLDAAKSQFRRLQRGDARAVIRQHLGKVCGLEVGQSRLGIRAQGAVLSLDGPNLGKVLRKLFWPKKPAGMTTREGDDILAKCRRQRDGDFVWLAFRRGLAQRTPRKV